MKSPRLTVVTAVRCLAGFFFVAGLAAVVVGAHDLTVAGGRLGVIFPAVLLVIAGAVFLAAASRLISMGQPRGWPEGKQPPCKQPAPFAFFVSILLGVYIFFGALTGVGAQEAIVLCVAGVFISMGSLGFALFWDDIEVSIVRVGAGVALSVAGLLVGGWEFWYQNQYLPSHLDRAVQVQVDLKKLATQGRYDVLSATFGYQDIGGRSVTVLGSDYTLTGSRIVTCPRPATPAEEAGFYVGELPDPQRARFEGPVWEVQPATVVATGRFIADGKRLGPNVPASRQMIFYVPHNQYQLLRLRAQAFAISSSVPLANQPPVERNLGDNDLYDLWNVGGSSWFQDLLSGHRSWIVTRYELVEAPGKTTPSPDLRVTARSPNPTWSGNAPSNTEIKDLFEKQPPLDTTETFSDTELPLAPVAQPTAAETVPKACASHHATAKPTSPTK
jgi:hypothetical protein